MPLPCLVPPARIACLLVLSFLSAACNRPTVPAPTPAKPTSVPALVTETSENGAISMEPLKPEPTTPTVKKGRQVPNVFDGPPVELASGQAWLSCRLDYATSGDGEPVQALDRKTLEAALAPCAERGVLRLRYDGRIAADFAALVARVAKVADDLKIRKRVLDLDSAGGQVEDAIHAGDAIGQSRWTLWVREDSVCHSACVLVLSGGDVRQLAGRVGIHRIIRMSSTATTRAELSEELRVVYDRVRDYLERNGTSTAVADLMKAVPNRSLRLLTDAELQSLGLAGINSAQDDLDRLRLQRECGDDFVSRRDAFARAFDRRCRATLRDLDDQNACGLALRARFGFPDADCPAESPLSEFDLGQAEPAPPKEEDHTPTAAKHDAPAAEPATEPAAEDDSTAEATTSPKAPA